MHEVEFAGVILAAGKGTRMKSNLPKCLHEVCGLPMAEHLVRTLRLAGNATPIVILGHGGDRLAAVLDSDVKIAWQLEQLGTGHATLMAKSFLNDYLGATVIVPGDCPLIKPESITKLIKTYSESKASAVVASVIVDDPSGYGRIIRGEGGYFKHIVEEKDATVKQKQIREINVSVYCFDTQLLMQLLPKIQNVNVQREYYLTDIFEMIVAMNKLVVVEPFDDPEEFQGVNDRWQLALTEESLRLKILKQHALNGVTLQNLHSIFIGPEVQLEHDCVILAGSQLKGRSKVGTGAVIGPNTVLSDTVVGTNSKILFSHCVRCEIGNDTTIGPFANIRPHSRIGNNCKLGNFVEVKNSTLDKNVSASHLSYIGDAYVGSASNIGAGTIFCNYDGYEKHQTEVGEGVFIGSNSTLVAPRIIGNHAIIAAGSVVTKDVPEGAAAFGRAKTEIKEGWAIQWRNRKKDNIDRTKESNKHSAMEPNPVEK